MVMHMDNIGDALRTSGYLLAQYISAADQVVRKSVCHDGAAGRRTWKFTGNFQRNRS